MNRNREMMLHELQQLDFRLYDLRLFLDTHPTDQKAFEEYRVTLSKGRAMRRHFEKLYGPLTINAEEDVQTSSNWVEGPWPWQYQEILEGKVCL